MESFDNTVKNYLGFLDNEYVSAGLSLFLILYAGVAAPKLPQQVVQLFDNTLVKLFVFFLIVYVSRKNPTVAIIAAVAVLVSLMTLNRIKFNQEMMEVVGGRRKVMMNGCDCDCPARDSDYELPLNSASEENQPLGLDSSSDMYESVLSSTEAEEEEMKPVKPAVEEQEQVRQEQQKQEEAVVGVEEAKHVGSELMGEEQKVAVESFTGRVRFGGIRRY